MRFFTSDLHLGHARICELAKRPFSCVEEMNEALIERWNWVVKPEDQVFILGDLVMGRFAETIELVARLAGHKSLVPGNHDRIHPAYQDTRPHKVAEWRAMYQEAGLFLHPPVVATQLGSVWPVVLSHFPYTADDLGRTEYDEWRPDDHGLWLLHGHSHGRGLALEARKRPNGRQIDVGVDCWDFFPVAEPDLVEIIEKVEE